MATNLRFHRLPFQEASLVYLLTATLIFAAANSVTRKLIDLGASHLVEGRNPISLCNVLFVGNLCALVILLCFYRPRQSQFKAIRCRDGSYLTLVAVFAGALGPGLIFSALDHTTVTSVVLLGRLEPLLALCFGLILFRRRINTYPLAGSGVTFLGVAVVALLNHSAAHWQLGFGELQAVAAALVLAMADVITTSRLRAIPPGMIALVRTSLGTFVFFWLAIFLYGPHHFRDSFSPFLWQWMLIYGGIIVVAGQILWLAGLKTATVGQITIASSINPLLGIGFAYLLLHEIPTAAQFWGGSVVLVGVLLSAIGQWQDNQHKRIQPIITKSLLNRTIFNI